MLPVNGISERKDDGLSWADALVSLDDGPYKANKIRVNTQ